MQHTRLLSKVFHGRGSKQLSRSRQGVSLLSRRFYEKDGEVGSPYRPDPWHGENWPLSREYWNKYYPAQSEKADEYEAESVYLDEIESRLRKYDKKYSHTEEVKKIYNQFGWEDQDDRAYHTYGGAFSHEKDELQYGRGKKLDPAQYVNGEVAVVTRKAIPPVEYLTAEQIRRSRGTLANFREIPPETPSIWKYWNIYSTATVFGALCLAKEFFIFGGHDMWDAVFYWSIFGCAGAVIADGLAFTHAVVSQEYFDREYFVIKQKADALNEQIEILATKPDDKAISLGYQAYRQKLSEKVLQKTLSNRVARLIEAAEKKLSDKLGEEASVLKGAENLWQKEALEKTLKHFDDAKVKEQFMKDAIKQFCAPDVASLKSTNTPTNPAVEVFKNKYNQFYQAARTNYVKDQKSKGSLSWVFTDASERAKQRMSKKDKESEFTKRIKAWEKTHNPVNAQMPAFA